VAAVPITIDSPSDMGPAVIAVPNPTLSHQAGLACDDKLAFHVDKFNATTVPEVLPTTSSGSLPAATSSGVVDTSYVGSEKISRNCDLLGSVDVPQ
jgi:hypothetical protein